jgi:hypothetical protein
MMFADREDIETRRVGKLRGLKDFLKPLLGADRLARRRARHQVAERIEPQLECHRIAASRRLDHDPIKLNRIKV